MRIETIKDIKGFVVGHYYVSGDYVSRRYNSIIQCRVQAAKHVARRAANDELIRRAQPT